MRALLIALLLLLAGAGTAAAQGDGLRSCGKLAVTFHTHAVVVYAGHTRCRTARKVGRGWVAGRVPGGWRCRAVPTDSGAFPRCRRGRRVVEVDVVVRGA